MITRSTIVAAALAAAHVTSLAAACFAAAPEKADADAAARAAAKYESLFGTEEKRAAATASGKDDAKLAARLVDQAKALGDEPALQALLYDKAYAMGLKDPDGYAAALAALKKLAEADPGRAEELRPKFQAVYRLQIKSPRPAERAEAGAALLSETVAEADRLAAAHRYADAVKLYKEAGLLAASMRSVRGEEIQVKLRAVTTRQSVQEKIDKLAARLKANPSDAAVLREVIDAYVLQLDNPGGAVPFAERAADPALKELLPLAARPVDDVEDLECLKLAEWYKGLAAKADAAGKGVALGRAVQYYARFLYTHDKQDADRLKATTGMDEATKLLNATGAAANFTADRIVLWNTHNGPGNSAGSTAVNVVLSLRGETVWKQENLKIPWEAGKEPTLALKAPKVPFDKIRVEITGWYQQCGGLTEIQVFRGSENIALGAPANASGSWDNTYPPSAVTDGDLSSEQVRKGYWLLPGNTAGWIDVDLRGGGKRK